MSEQDNRSRVVDAMCMTWRHDFGLDKREHALGSCGMTDEERDALRRQMGQLYDHHIAHLVGSASLPVGVPDGYMPIPTAEQLAEALSNVRCFHDMSADLIAPELLANLLAAIAGQDASVANSAIPNYQDARVAQSAGEAGEREAVEVVGWQDAENPLYTTAERRVMHEWVANQYPIVELMTVAQHQRIVAQIAARDAGEVRVPIELLTKLVRTYDNSVIDAAHWTDMDGEIEQLRALLAQRERGGE